MSENSAIAILDVEASGLHFDSYPIEIAVLKGEELAQWLIKPLPHWTYWSEDAEALHGISRAQLESEGLAPERVASELNDFLADWPGPVYSDAPQWDGDWVKILYHDVGQQAQFYFAHIFDFFWPAQGELFKQHCAELAASGAFREHRAAEDVQIIHAAWRFALAN